jgi:pimeloyl-ACP methyl ester carboxylesterase
MPLRRTAVVTRFGVVEYAERGSGEPLLAIHSFCGGCDSALLPCAAWLLTAGSSPHRGLATWAQVCLRAPARPIRPTRFAALLDGLGIDRLDVTAISSGATSALQCALRHPDRLKHLAVICGNLPRNLDSHGPPKLPGCSTGMCPYGR